MDNMDKKDTLILVVVGLLIIAGAVYFLVFDEPKTEMDARENAVAEGGTKDATDGQIKYKSVNVFGNVQDTEQQEPAEEQGVLTEEEQNLVNPYDEIEDKANPFKNTFENPFE